jgi:hypothetical protein
LDNLSVRILNSGDEIVGTGFWVGERHVLTCAHVVGAALGLDDAAIGAENEPLANVKIGHSKNSILRVKVCYWRPRNDQQSGDIAVLEVHDSQNIRPFPVFETGALDNLDFSCRGFPFQTLDSEGEIVTGTVLGILSDRAQLDSESSQKIRSGYSGAPVTSLDKARIFGMVVEVYSDKTPTAYMIPAIKLQGAINCVKRRREQLEIPIIEPNTSPEISKPSNISAQVPQGISTSQITTNSDKPKIPPVESSDQKGPDPKLRQKTWIIGGTMITLIFGTLLYVSFTISSGMSAAPTKLNPDLIAQSTKWKDLPAKLNPSCAVHLELRKALTMIQDPKNIKTSLEEIRNPKIKGSEIKENRLVNEAYYSSQVGTYWFCDYQNTTLKDESNYMESQIRLTHTYNMLLGVVGQTANYHRYNAALSSGQVYHYHTSFEKTDSDFKKAVLAFDLALKEAEGQQDSEAARAQVLGEQAYSYAELKNCAKSKELMDQATIIYQKRIKNAPTPDSKKSYQDFLDAFTNRLKKCK